MGTLAIEVLATWLMLASVAGLALGATVRIADRRRTNINKIPALRIPS
jgi:hypothetical protein